MNPSFIDASEFAAYQSRPPHPAYVSTLPACRGSRPNSAVPMDLAMNAIDATSDTDGIRVIILSSRYDDGKQLLASVNDAGIGLAISRSIESHSGGSSATSNLGEGATFYFTSPIPFGANA